MHQVNECESRISGWALQHEPTFSGCMWLQDMQQVVHHAFLVMLVVRRLLAKPLLDAWDRGHSRQWDPALVMALCQQIVPKQDCILAQALTGTCCVIQQTGGINDLEACFSMMKHSWLECPASLALRCKSLT